MEDSDILLRYKPAGVLVIYAMTCTLPYITLCVEIHYTAHTDGM